MLDCQLYGLRPAGHHLSNLLLHAASAVLLFIALDRMTAARWRSAWVAALFALHPAHVESVAWIAERKDVLSGLFWMLTLCAYASYARQPGWTRFLATFLFFTLGLMAKPMIVTLPFVLLLLDWWPLQRYAAAPAAGIKAGPLKTQGVPRWPLSRLLLEKLPFLALSAGCCAVTFWAQNRGQAVVSIEKLPILERISHALVSYVHYLGMLVFPRHLAVFYPYPADEPGIWAIGAALALAAVSAGAILVARRQPWLLFGWLWFAGCLVPVIGLVQVGDQAWADRYTYLPMIGPFIAVVWGLADLARNHPAVKWAATAATLALLAATSSQIRYWKDTRALFEHAAKVTPNNYLALALLGSLRTADGRPDQAIDLCSEALRCKTNYPEARFFLGQALEEEGKLDEAVVQYTDAVRLKPAFEPAHIFLGLALVKQKKYDLARAQYEQALQINPQSAAARNDLGRLLQTQNRLEESIGEYRAALQIDPSLAQAHNNLGVALLQKGEPAPATVELRESLRLSAGDGQTQYNLALALEQQNQWAEASQLLAPIAATQTNNAAVQYQYALALAGAGKTRQALSHYAGALLLTPDFPEALNQLAWTLATDSHPEFRNGVEAVPMAEKACELTGGQRPAMLETLAAAYSEAGRMDDALAAARKARDIAAQREQKDWQAKAERLLSLIQTRQPIRQESPQ
jgi:tetratricopeptide (TPR) repeat protein